MNDIVRVFDVEAFVNRDIAQMEKEIKENQESKAIDINDASYLKVDGGYVLLHYHGNEESYEIIDNTIGIDEGAFVGNETLIRIRIPATVTRIKGNAFCCTNLEAIEVDEANPRYYSKDGVLYTKKGNSAPSYIVRYPIAKRENIVSIENVQIWDYAFAGCKYVKELIVHGFPPRTSYNSADFGISYYAFKNSSVKKIHLELFTHQIGILPESLEGSDAKLYAYLPEVIYKHSDINSLCSVQVEEEQFTTVQDEFGGIYSEDGKVLVKYMGENHIYKIKEGTKLIKKGAFSNIYNLVSIYIPKSIEYIEDGAFSGCTNLSHISLESENKGGYYLEGNKLMYNNYIDWDAPKDRKRIVVSF